MKAAILLVLALAICACGAADPDQPGNEVSDRGATVPPMPADFVFEVSEGGGFAGTYDTSRVTAAGELFANDVKTATVPQSTRQSLWEALHRAGFFEMESKPGNMSTGINVIADGKTTWVARETPPAADDDFHRLARECQALIKQTSKPID